MRRISVGAAAAIFSLATTFPVFAEEASMTVGASAKARKTVDIACVQKAVDRREDALGAGWTAFNASVGSAYAARKTALHDAWGMSDAAARRFAVKTAWENFKKSKKSAVQAWKSARKSAWKTFRGETKACKGVAAEVSVEAAGEAADND